MKIEISYLKLLFLFLLIISLESVFGVFLYAAEGSQTPPVVQAPKAPKLSHALKKLRQANYDLKILQEGLSIAKDTVWGVAFSPISAGYSYSKNSVDSEVAGALNQARARTRGGSFGINIPLGHPLTVNSLDHQWQAQNYQILSSEVQLAAQLIQHINDFGVAQLKKYLYQTSLGVPKTVLILAEKVTDPLQKQAVLAAATSQLKEMQLQVNAANLAVFQGKAQYYKILGEDLTDDLISRRGSTSEEKDNSSSPSAYDELVDPELLEKSIRKSLAIIQEGLSIPWGSSIQESIEMAYDMAQQKSALLHSLQEAHAATQYSPQREWLNTITLGAQYGDTTQRDQIYGFDTNNDSTVLTASVRLDMGLPHRIKAARAQVRKSQLQLEQARRLLKVEFMSLYPNIQAIEDNFELTLSAYIVNYKAFIELNNEINRDQPDPDNLKDYLSIYSQFLNYSVSLNSVFAAMTLTRLQILSKLETLDELIVRMENLERMSDELLQQWY